MLTELLGEHLLRRHSHGARRADLATMLKHGERKLLNTTPEDLDDIAAAMITLTAALQPTPRRLVEAHHQARLDHPGPTALTNSSSLSANVRPDMTRTPAPERRIRIAFVLAPGQDRRLDRVLERNGDPAVALGLLHSRQRTV
jgi:hypothetical protein